MAIQGWVIRAVAIIVATAGMGGPARAEDFDYGRYKPATYQQALEHIRGALPEQPYDGPVYMADPHMHPWRLRMRHTGEVRPLRPEIRRAIEHFAGSTQYPEPFVALFQHEVRFDADGTMVWLPIQTPLIEPLQAEARVGEPVDLYVTLVGGVDEEPVLTINEFEAPAPRRPASQH